MWWFSPIKALKYISVPKHGATISEIEDVGAVADDDLSEDFVTVTGAEVAGVMSLGIYCSCLNCKRKVNPTSGKLGMCTNCGMVQKIEHSKKQLSAKVVLSVSDGVPYTECV